MRRTCRCCGGLSFGVHLRGVWSAAAASWQPVEQNTPPASSSSTRQYSRFLPHVSQIRQARGGRIGGDVVRCIAILMS
jgi:hypothetical protein